MRGGIYRFPMYSRIPMPMFEWKRGGHRSMPCNVSSSHRHGDQGSILRDVPAALMASSGSFLAAGILLTAVPIFITGGIHMDGFMDTCDARASYGDRGEETRDLEGHPTGAFAVIFGALYLILYAAACLELERETAMLVSIGL